MCSTELSLVNNSKIIRNEHHHEVSKYYYCSVSEGFQGSNLATHDHDGPGWMYHKLQAGGSCKRPVWLKESIHFHPFSNSLPRLLQCGYSYAQMGSNRSQPILTWCPWGYTVRGMGTRQSRPSSWWFGKYQQTLNLPCSLRKSWAQHCRC